MKLFSILPVLPLLFSSAISAGLNGIERKLFADPTGPAVIEPRVEAGDILNVTLGILEGTYDGFCTICNIGALLNADQIYCILCNIDIDGDNVDGQDPDQLYFDVQCFSGQSTVEVEHVGAVPMKDLQVGSKILTQSGKYEPVYAWGHKNPSKSAEFLQFQTKESTLEMTGGHLVFLEGQMNPVRADSIKVGDNLQGHNGQVKKISTIHREGVYSPLTPSGTLVVDGMVASSYISLQKGADEFVEFQGGISSHLSFQDFIHMVLSPYRMLCMGISPSIGNVYTEEGIPLYASLGLEFAKWAEQQHLLVQLVLFLVVGAVAGAFMFVENIFGASFAPLAVVVGGGAYAMKKKSNVIMNFKFKSV